MDYKIIKQIRNEFLRLADYWHSLFGASTALTVAVLLFGCYRSASINWGQHDKKVVDLAPGRLINGHKRIHS